MARAKAGSKEDVVSSLLREKVKGLVLSGKRRFQGANVEISTDESFTYDGITYLVEVDSGNMAKVLVGQYVLLNALHDLNKEKLFFLVVHTYKKYNPQRTLSNLEFANQQFFANNGIRFGAIHLDSLKTWCGGNVKQLLAMFAQAQQSAPGDAPKAARP